MWDAGWCWLKAFRPDQVSNIFCEHLLRVASFFDSIVHPLNASVFWDTDTNRPPILENLFVQRLTSVDP